MRAHPPPQLRGGPPDIRPTIPERERKVAGAEYELDAGPNEILVRETARFVAADDVLESSFPVNGLRSLIEYDALLDEGPRHRGMSAVVDLVADAR